MPFFLGFLFVTGVYGLLFYVSRLEKKRQQKLGDNRGNARLQQRQPVKKAHKKNENARAVRASQQFRSAEVKALEYDRKLAASLEDLDQGEQRLQKREKAILDREKSKPNPRPTAQRSPRPETLKPSKPKPQDDWETPRQVVLDDDWQQPSQAPVADLSEPVQPEKVQNVSQRREQAKQTQRELARLENERSEQARTQFRETLSQKDLEADRQRQIQEEKEQKLQQEMEADRQRVRHEKQEADRKRYQEMEADRLRLRREKEASDRQREQEMESDRLRLRQQQQQSKIPDRISPEILRQSCQVTRQIKSKLEKLCGSDYRLAQRLVDGIRFDHPDRSEQWCWEKAVRDMERDRRY